MGGNSRLGAYSNKYGILRYIKALILDFLIGDQNRSETLICFVFVFCCCCCCFFCFFQNRLFPRLKGQLCISMVTVKRQGGIIQIMIIELLGLLKTFRRQKTALNM